MSQKLNQEEKLQNFINGEWLEPGNGAYADVTNPATLETLVQVPLSGKEEVASAVEAAKKAQKDWALVPAPQRAEVLYRVGLIMKERKEYLSRWLTMENGKVLEEARGEVQEGIDMAFYMAGEGR
ncbi:MAG: aldehyde dehydrogenase family protein, partial [Halobacillus sp.]